MTAQLDIFSSAPCSTSSSLRQEGLAPTHDAHDLYGPLEEEPEQSGTGAEAPRHRSWRSCGRCLARTTSASRTRAGDATRCAKVREALASGEYTPGRRGRHHRAPSITARPPTVMTPDTVMAPHARGRAAHRRGHTIDLASAAPAAETLKGERQGPGGPHAREPAGGLSPAAYGRGAASALAVYAGRGRSSTRAGSGGGDGAQGLVPAPAPAPADHHGAGELKEALVGNQVELARVDLENGTGRRSGRAERSARPRPFERGGAAGAGPSHASRAGRRWPGE